MDTRIDRLIGQFESGRLSRRQLVTHLGALVALLGGAGRGVAAEEGSTFQAVGIDHVALRVTDVPRSRDFYAEHLGLTVSRDGGDNSCFLNCGHDFLALFKGEQARMDHFCFEIEDYDPDAAVEKLKAAGFDAHMRRTANRVYFDDPDGLEVQISSAD